MEGRRGNKNIIYVYFNSIDSYQFKLSSSKRTKLHSNLQVEYFMHSPLIRLQPNLNIYAHSSTYIHFLFFFLHFFTFPIFIAILFFWSISTKNTGPIEAVILFLHLKYKTEMCRSPMMETIHTIPYTVWELQYFYEIQVPSTNRFIPNKSIL